MIKVNEPDNTDESWECPRCNQNYCGDCVDKIKVDFIIEHDYKISEVLENSQKYEVEWEGRNVCPWCYNQLIDKYGEVE